MSCGKWAPDVSGQAGEAASGAVKKAFLLAAGLGTRLYPLTQTTPKCLVPVGGRPLLAYWVDLLAYHGFTDVLVNLHHLPDQVTAFLDQLETDIRFEPFFEPELLGSAGTVRENRAFAGDAPFLVAYADDLTDANLSALMAAHSPTGPMLTMALFEAPEPHRCGIAELDAAGTIVSFEEKPAAPKSSLANAGLYVSDGRLFDVIPDETPADFGRHVLPRLIGRMRGYRLTESLIDVGTPESYAAAQRTVAQLAWPWAQENR
jgi:mannose-1-phosphate guanylyltransferase